MTNHRLSIVLCVAALGSAACFSTGCSDKKTAIASDPATVAAAPAPASAVAAPVIATSAASAGVTPVVWADIKDDTFAQRIHFTAGLKGLESGVDDQIIALKAKRAALPAGTDITEWDFAMKEMGDAHAYLLSMGEELDKATADTWAQAKERVAQAWERSQAAYDKVKGSTTA